MLITIVAVLCVFLFGALAPDLVASFRRYDWYPMWIRWLNQHMTTLRLWRSRFGIAYAIAPPVLVTLILQIIFSLPLYGLPSALLGIVVLMYVWGPSDLDRDVETIVDARDIPTQQAAATRLWPPGVTLQLSKKNLIQAVFINSMSRWFGVVFWFVLLGPCGAVLYRLAVLSATGNTINHLPQKTLLGAQRLLALLNWPVAQLMTLSLAIVGSFDTVLAAWRQYGGFRCSFSIKFMLAAAYANVMRHLQGDSAGSYVQASDLPETSSDDVSAVLLQAMNQVWRILLLWIVIMSLFVIIDWFN